MEAWPVILLEDKINPTLSRIKELLYNQSKDKTVVHVDQPVVKQYDSLLELVA